MCIIMVKKKGIKLPNKETFKTCFDNNPDGAGFMYVENGHVVIKKGYMGVRRLYRDILNVLRKEDKNIVVHFRIGTSGTNDARTTHPYPISRDKKDLQALSTNTDLGMVHNGIISGYKDVQDLSLNDTQVFIRDVVSVLQELKSDFYKNIRVLDMLDDLSASKLCFLDNEDNLYYVGTFYDENGMFYSNTTYKSYNYNYNSYGYGKGYESYTYKDSNSPYTDWEEDDDDIYDKLDLIAYKDETFDMDIDYDNFVNLKTGTSVSSLRNDFVKIIYSDNLYGLDGCGNLVEMYNGIPKRIVEPGCFAWDEYGNVIEVI